MSIRFIIGRSGSGKSWHLLEEIRAKLVENAEGSPLVLLVPEQATFQAELTLVATPGLKGIIRAQVLSFHRLAFRIMQETGGITRIPIDDIGKKMLLNRIVRSNADKLTLFQHAGEQSGFFDSLHTLFTEFKRYCLTSDALQTHLETKAADLYQGKTLTSDKLRDLVLIYRAYEEELSRLYVQSDDYLTQLAEQIQYSEVMQTAEVWIDGFHGFTPQEHLVVEKLLQHCPRVTVALCLDKPYGALDKPDELELFHPTAVTMIRLQEAAARLNVKVEPIECLMGAGSMKFQSPMLHFSEQHYGHKRIYEPAAIVAGKSAQADISVHTAVHRRAEVEGAAREMVRLVRDCGYRWRDLAVIIRDEEAYGDLFATVFADYEIPFFLDMKKSVLHHPLVEFIRSSLEVVLNNWQYDAVFRAVKTDFLLPAAGKFEEGQAFRRRMDELENYVLAFGIQGSRWTDKAPWNYKLNVSLVEEAEAETAEAAEAAEAVETAETAALYAEDDLDRINEARRWVVNPLSHLQLSMKESLTANEMLIALFELLESVNASARLEQWSEECIASGYPEKAREHTQLWGSIIDLLDQISEMWGPNPLSLELFAEMVETGLASIKLAHVPPTLDQVLIGSLERTRSSRIKVSFILGVNDGVMPQRMKENGVLSEQERERLSESGLAIAPGSRRKLLDEQFLIYNALTAPSDRLWMSCPLADEEGKSLLPSELIRRIRLMFPQIPYSFITMEPPAAFSDDAQLDFIAHPAKVLSLLSVQFRQWALGNRISEIWWEAYNWFCSRQEWRDPLRNLVMSLRYTNREQDLHSKTSSLLYGNPLQASVSRMEKFVACPFSHFVSHGLRLHERRAYRLEAPDIGQLFHAVLSTIGTQLLQEGILWGQLTADQCRQRAEAAVELLKPRLQSEILLSSKRFHYISRKLKEIAARASVVIGEHARRSAFTPIGLELDFGPNKSMPALSFTLENGHMMDIVGRIDRVDYAQGDQGMLLRVIDYKSSQTSLQLSDVYYGLSLQMLTYLDVVLTHAEHWLGSQAKPAGVLYFHVHNPLLQTKSAVSIEEAEDQLFKRFKMKGLLLAETSAIQLMDHGLDQGHSALLPVSLKADGGFYKHSSVASEQQWNILRHHVRGTIRQIGEDIVSGKVDIHPFHSGGKSACTFCSYKSICQFESQFEGNEFHMLPPISKDELWTRLEENRQRE